MRLFKGESRRETSRRQLVISARVTSNKSPEAHVERRPQGSPSTSAALAPIDSNTGRFITALLLNFGSSTSLHSIFPTTDTFASS